MDKAEVSKHKSGSAEYVVMHARRQRSKGRRPSVAFLWELNPKKALRLAQRMAYFPVKGIYLAGVSLAKYKCAKCGARGCKLWREYQTIAPQLLCAKCAAESEKRNIGDIDADGRRSCEFGGRTDQIGWYVPAVPTEDGLAYWGYTSVPNPGIDWWRNLPTLPQKS